jgi:hypothetical protein
LVNFRFAPLTLQIDFLFDTSFSEDMMATSDALFKTQVKQQPAQIIERDMCIRAPLQNLQQQFVMLTQADNLS